MFILRLLLYQKLRDLKYGIIIWLNRDKYLPKEIFHDILESFLDDNTSVYKLYMRNAPIGELDLQYIYQTRTSNYNSMNEAELHILWDVLIDYLQVRLIWYPSINLIIHNENGVKYIEIYRKNYRQVI